MNLLERDSKTKDNIAYPEEGTSHQNMIYIFVAFVFLFLIILIFVFWMHGRTQNRVSDTTQQVEANVNGMQTESVKDTLIEDEIKDLSTGEEQQTDLQEQVKQDVLTGSSTPIVVEEDKEQTAHTDVLLNPEKQMDPLDQDMSYEDDSYEKSYIMKEMSDWWDVSQVSAMYDLSALRRYRKLSYSLKGTNQYYYYGDTDSEGKPHGKGCAMYADDTYYFGDFVHGKREGTGYWLRFYYDTKMEGARNGIYTMHSYAGGWKNDLPDGDGQEHFDVDITKISEDDVVIQNVIGHFGAGLYDGEMFANTVNQRGEVSEWDAKAEKGVFAVQGLMPPSGDYPVWRNRADEERILRIGKDENKNCGIKELLK